MRLEIRDLEDTTLYEIGPDGAVLGRERAKTDISLRDESVSKRHARIFPDEGIWLLEDLNSSNGTYIEEQRITGPVQIGQGSVFALAQRKFEVVYAEGADEYPPPPPGVGSGVNSGLGPPPDIGVAAGQNMESRAYDSGMGSGPAADENKGVGAIFAALPKAIAYYIVNVPLMLLNPIGTIKKGSDEQPVEPMGKMELAAFAIPAGAVTPLVGAVFAMLALLVNGAFSIAPIIGALVGGAIGAVVAAVGGFLLHPILEFVVRLLKGTSDPRSRTNYGVQAFTLSIVAALPQGIGAFLGALPIPFIRLVGPLLVTVVSLVFLFFAYRWVVSFQLVKWVRYVVLVLGGLSVLGALAGLVQGAIAEVNAPSAPSGTAGEMHADAAAAAAAAAAAGGIVSDDDVADAQQTAEQAAARAAALARDGAGASEEAVARALDAAKQKQAEAARIANAGGRAEPARADSASRQAPPPAAPPATALRSGTPAPAAPRTNSDGRAVVTDEHPLGETEFVRFLAKRNAIERAINDMPHLLDRRPLKKDYERLWRKTYSIRDKYRRKRGERWKRDKILARRKNRDVFEATRKEVDRVYDQIFPQ